MNAFWNRIINYPFDAFANRRKNVIFDSNTMPRFLSCLMVMVVIFDTLNMICWKLKIIFAMRTGKTGSFFVMVMWNNNGK